MTARRGSKVVILACLVATAALAQVGSSAPPPSLRQELEEGRAAWFLNGASALKLNYAQQQVVLGAGQLVRAKSAQVAATRKRLLVLLADGIAAGTFDDAAIAKDLQDMSAAASEREPAVVQALIQLHEGLTPEQSKTVISTVRQGLATLSSNSSAPSKVPQALVQQRVGQITDQVGLSPAQQAQVKSDIVDAFKLYAPDLKEEQAARAAQVEAMCKDFTNLYYRPSVASVSAGSELVEKSTRLIALIKKLTGILTPAQRARAAAVVRERNNLDPSEDGG
jgi:Spy/CpxP family protein refolding chaperone